MERTQPVGLLGDGLSFGILRLPVALASAAVLSYRACASTSSTILATLASLALPPCSAGVTCFWDCINAYYCWSADCHNRTLHRELAVEHDIARRHHSSCCQALCFANNALSCTRSCSSICRWNGQVLHVDMGKKGAVYHA